MWQRSEVFHPTIRGEPEHVFAAGDAGGVGDPEPVRPGRGELPVD